VREKKKARLARRRAASTGDFKQTKKNLFLWKKREEEGGAGERLKKDASGSKRGQEEAEH